MNGNIRMGLRHNVSIHNAMLTWKTCHLCAGHSTPEASATSNKERDTQTVTSSPMTLNSLLLSYHWLQPSVDGNLSWSWYFLPLYTHTRKSEKKVKLYYPHIHILQLPLQNKRRIKSFQILPRTIYSLLASGDVSIAFYK